VLNSTLLVRGFACGLAAVALSLAAAFPVAADTAAVVAPSASAFSYGTILNSLDDAALARAGGFNLMSAFVAWSSVEPSRGQYLFEQKDR
jgi:hypothetical protein